MIFLNFNILFLVVSIIFIFVRVHIVSYLNLLFSTILNSRVTDPHHIKHTPSY